MDWSIYKVSPYAISPSRFKNGLNSSIDYNTFYPMARVMHWNKNEDDLLRETVSQQGKQAQIGQQCASLTREP